MKKFLFLLGGVVTLAACSDDFSQANDSKQTDEVLLDNDFKKLQ